MALSAKGVEALKPKEKLYRVSDELPGLLIEVAPNGSKRWRYRFTKNGKANMISLGVYPDVSLTKARSLALDARKTLVDGETPKGRRLRAEKGELVFYDLVDEWIKEQERLRAKCTMARYRQFRVYIAPIGDIPPAKITPLILVELCKRIADEHTVGIAHRVLTFISQVMRYAIPSGRIPGDATIGVRAGIPAENPTKHRAAITTPSELPELLEEIDHHGSVVMRCYLQLMALWWCRAGELTQAKWEEIDWEQKLYRIPAERMKMRREHLVPIARQAEAILRLLQGITAPNSPYIFPKLGDRNAPMGRSSPMQAIKKFQGRMTIHGFRSTASTLLNERGWNPDVIEAQLAHQDSNAVRRAYNRAQYLEDRRRMMQEWADYLDELRAKN